MHNSEEIKQPEIQKEALVDKIKKMDKTYAFIIVVSIIFGTSMVMNFFEKHMGFIKKPIFGNEISNKVVGQYKIGKVCYDKEGVTECIEIAPSIYKVSIYNENTDSLPTLHIKSK